MSVEAPDRIRVAQDSDGFWTCSEAVSGSQEYVRADLFHDLEKQHARCRDRSVVVSIGDVGYYVSQGVADKLEELAAHSRLQAEDIMTLGQMVGKAETALAEAKRENEALREALEAMLEPYEDDPCWHDHHGYCQAHFLQEDCCVAEARAVLSRNAGGNDAE